MYKRMVLVVMMTVFQAFAADPGGGPGLIKADLGVVSQFSEDDIMAHAQGYVLCPEELYSTGIPAKGLIAWFGYMYMQGGVSYRFKGCCNEYGHILINGQQILSGLRMSRQIMTGSFTPSKTDWYEIVLYTEYCGDEFGNTKNNTPFGILWSTDDGVNWYRIQDKGDGSLLKTGQVGLRFAMKASVPMILSSKMRKTDRTVLDVSYIVHSPKPMVDVRALAFQDGERSFFKIVRPKTFVNDEAGNPTAGNIGDGMPANRELKLAWKVPSDWDVDIAKVKFEILTSEAAQLPMKTLTIPATAKNPAMTIAYNSQTDADIFNALLWYWANGVADLLNNNGDGYIDLDHPYPNQVDTANIRIVNRTTIANRPEALRYLYKKMGWEPLEGGNLMDYVRKSTRKDLWFNSGNQTCAIKTSTKPTNLYIGDKAYCVIDVSGGPSAASYPVSYLDTEPVSGWGDVYKTTKILLRRCDPGLFRMQNNKDVTLTKPFYMGVFTVTQKQYEQVMGSNPTPNDHKANLRPVEISWNAIRGNSSTYNWPTVKTVDPATFVGKIQAKTGLNFDLPTEAQWEMACRAGTSSNYGNGGGGDNDLRLMGHSWSDNAVSVGLYLPNFWGFYDMHGNVGQWCLDFSDGYNSDPAIDYVGAGSGAARSVRGYNRYNYSSYATSFNRYGVDPASNRFNGYFSYLGFRLSRPLTE